MSSRPIRKVKTSTVKARSRNKKIAIAAVISIIIILVAVVAILSQSTPETGDPATSASPSVSPTATGSSSPTSTATPLTSPEGQYSENGTRVLLETSMGNIIIQLRDDKPITTTNFVNLVNQGFYDETIFHRVMEGFMIQGGYNSTTNASNIEDEIGNDNHNYNGTIAMANKAGEADSASSQFFINVANNNNLYSSFDSTYTVFGKVIDGMDVVMAISHVAVEQTNLSNAQPVENVTLISATILS
ncbi:MAG: peptidylprolyl isomerase [Crenarchaeota archaeon]|mgnify:CR=1 FL=1|nr:peptidylprolyl isomerase [Thermoproteota archaeon]